MISATVHQQQINDITRFLDGNAKKIRQQLYIATNKAAGKTKSMIAKELGKVVNTPQKNIKKTIFLRKAKPGSQRKAFVTQRGMNGLPIRFFKPEQTLAGVVYKPFKGKGKELIKDAFMGPGVWESVNGERRIAAVGTPNPKWKGNAYKREGRTRRPITLQRGPSILHVFKERNVEPIAVTFATTQLQKEVTERARFLGLKKSGAI